jgi:hypothetical protein
LRARPRTPSRQGHIHARARATRITNTTTMGKAGGVAVAAPQAAGPTDGAGAGPARASEGETVTSFFLSKINELELNIKDKSHNLRRLEAQRNELNTQGE